MATYLLFTSKGATAEQIEADGIEVTDSGVLIIKKHMPNDASCEAKDLKAVRVIANGHWVEVKFL